MAKWTLEYLLGMEPQDFEILLTSLFSAMEYRTELTQYSRDRGIDIVINIEKFGLSHTWLVQAKRYSGSVGVKDVREYSSLRYRDRVDGVIIVSTSAFTKEAVEEAAEHNVKLIDGDLLVGMLNHYLPDGYSGTIDISDQEDRKTTDGTILKNGEQLIAKENVMIRNERYTLDITNKNIFLKKESSGIFSKSSKVEERIKVEDILGMHTETNRSVLIAGKKKLNIYPINSNKTAVLAEIFDNLRPRYLKGEHLILSSRNRTELTLFTNKRLIVTDISAGTQNDIINKKIVYVELKSGFLKKGQLIVSEDSGTIKKHPLYVSDPENWKNTIEQCVRML